MHAYARAYSKLCQFHYIYICVCVYIYSNGNVLPSILVPVYVLYIFCYHTLLYGGNKEIYLSIYLLWTLPPVPTEGVTIELTNMNNF